MSGRDGRQRAIVPPGPPPLHAWACGRRCQQGDSRCASWASPSCRDIVEDDSCDAWHNDTDGGVRPRQFSWFAGAFEASSCRRDLVLERPSTNPPARANCVKVEASDTSIIIGLPLQVTLAYGPMGLSIIIGVTGAVGLPTERAHVVLSPTQQPDRKKGDRCITS